MKEQIFVFVVCGRVDHIKTLHYSLASLKKFSRKKIIVLTDSSRNECAIQHDSIVDIKTPEELNNHQASIFLKTAIHRFVPKGNIYCYLDTDVVALSSRVDEIFQEFVPPILFAQDHCRMDKFSPSAINCGCLKEFKTRANELRFQFKKHRHLQRQPENEEKKAKLLRKLKEIKENKIQYKLLSFRFNFSRYKFRLDEDNFFDKQKQVWQDAQGNAVLYEKEESAIKEIETKTDYRCDIANNHKWTYHGKEVFDFRCDHLAKQIYSTFGIKVSDYQWQHWNGGVFLFNEQSHSFLENWHGKTLQIFKQPIWKTRDQGTLIATVWEFQMEDHPTLPFRFNLIADYNHDALKHLGQLRFSIGGKQQFVNPEFIHVYHHWADKEWDVWQAIEERTGIVTIPEENIINALWIGNQLSPIELLTIKSFLDKGHLFKIWTYEPLQNQLPDGIMVGDANEIIPKEKVFRYKNRSQFGHGKGSVAGFSDVFRYKLLYEKGGWWVDMDITCLKRMDFDGPYFFRKHHQLNVVGNVIKCPKGSRLMKSCYEEAIVTINEDNSDWHKPIEILNKYIEDFELNGFIVEDCSNQDRWDETSKFIYSNEEYPDHWYFIHWQNEEWRNKGISKTTFYYRSTLASLLANYGLFFKPTRIVAKWKNEFLFATVVRKIMEGF